MKTEEKQIIFRKDAKLLGIKQYYTGKPCKYGHVDYRFVLNGQCSECSRIRSRRFSLIYYANNRDKIMELSRKKYHDNREYYLALNKKRTDKNKAKERAKKWRQDNRQKHREYSKQWRIDNPDGKNKYERDRCKNDAVYFLMQTIRKSILSSFRRNGYTKKSRTYQILGCTFIEFKIHIEKQFLKGMSWDNRKLWHIDHVVPISSAKNENDVIMLNHFTNLRPLWARDNILKSDKMEFLI